MAQLTLVLGNDSEIALVKYALQRFRKEMERRTMTPAQADMFMTATDDLLSRFPTPEVPSAEEPIVKGVEQFSTGFKQTITGGKNALGK